VKRVGARQHKQLAHHVFQANGAARYTRRRRLASAGALSIWREVVQVALMGVGLAEQKKGRALLGRQVPKSG